jgi:hypothetical protein
LLLFNNKKYFNLLLKFNVSNYKNCIISELMKKKLKFLLCYSLNFNDYKSANSKTLFKNFDVEFIDISYLLLPKKIFDYYEKNSYGNKINNYHNIKTFSQFKNKISNSDIIFDFNQISLKNTNILFKEQLFKMNKKICLFSDSSIPNFTNHRLLFKIIFLYNFFNLIFKFNYEIQKYFYKNLLLDYFKLFFSYFFKINKKNISNLNIDCTVITNDLIEKKYKSHFLHSKFIYSHSKDYENFFFNKTKSIQKKKYALFLDENIFFHPDNIQWNEYYRKNLFDYYRPIYFRILNNFFDQLEEKLGSEVIIAGHPKGPADSISGNFYNKRKIIKNKTQELVCGSRLVLTHSSMSVSYAMFAKKPIAFLNSPILLPLGIFTRVLSFALESSAPSILLEDKKINFNNLLNNDKIKYQEFIKKYFKSSKSNIKESIWDSLNKGLNYRN